MSGSFCTPACGPCGRCNAPDEEDPEPVEAIEDSPDCPTCGAKVEGRWAVLEVVRLSYSSPAEWEPRCGECVGSSRRLRMELADALHEDMA